MAAHTKAQARPRVRGLSEVSRATAREALQKARAVARVRAPYLYGALCRLVPVEVPIGTMGVTERGHLLYDPRAVVEWTKTGEVEPLAGVLCHEVLHLVAQHLDRRGDRDPRRWNIAGDLWINAVLRECGFDLPEGGLFPEQFGFEVGLTADEYYDLLVRQQQGDDDGDDANGDDDGDDANGDDDEDDANGDDDEDDANGDDGNGDGGAPGPGDWDREIEIRPAAAGECGSGAGGDPLPFEPQDGATDEDGDPLPSMTEREREQLARQVAAAVQEAASRDPGSVPAGLRREAERLMRPAAVRWSELLHRYASEVTMEAGRGHRTYRRPSRRQSSVGYGPGRPLLASSNKRRASVWMVVDTSGSMSPEDLGHALDEIHGAVTAAGASVYVLAADAATTEPVEVRDVGEAKRLLVGGGGTSFVPAFRRADRAHDMGEPCAPDLLVYVTDGYGSAPDTPPTRYHTTWAITPNGRVPARWGEVVQIPGGTR